MCRSPAESRRFILRVEDQSDEPDPTLDLIRTVIGELTCDGGPSFAILLEDEEDDAGDYVQVAGGYDPSLDAACFTLERRVYRRDYAGRVIYARPCQHFVAGHLDRDAQGEVRIATNGYQVTVRENEILNAANVIDLFQTFLATRYLPSHFRWRTNKEEVEEIGRDTVADRQRH